jgi:serine/threonine-protein kinase
MDYAAPEVRAGAAFSAASDVYALGLLLFRLLTGKRPFPVSGGEPVPARKVCPACPRGLEGLLMAMLGPTPDTRPSLATIQTALEDVQAELAADLAEHEDEPAGPPPAASEPAPAVAAADTIAAGPVTDAADATATDVEPASRGRQGSGAEPARDRRGVSPWALGLTAAACLAIGRASVGRDEPVDRDAASPMTGASDERHEPRGEAEERAPRSRPRPLRRRLTKGSRSATGLRGCGAALSRCPKRRRRHSVPSRVSALAAMSRVS